MINDPRVFSMYEIISKKRDGKELLTEEIAYFTDHCVRGDIPDYQTAALLMAIFLKGLSPRELADLTGLMMRSGDTISLSGILGKKIDKHSTGGVGDKISFIVAPLTAACGVRVPMLSGRSLGHTGGTLDKLEAIPGMNVFLNTDEFRAALEQTGMAICGQTENIVPADRILYALRDATATVNSIPLISASIMSKKLALASDGIVLDVKTGSGAFMPAMKDSLELCQTMVDIGEKNGRTTVGLITDMDQPLGVMTGNSLEIEESIETLKGRGSAEVMEVTLGLGAAMLLAAGAEKNPASARERLLTALHTGKGLDIFRRFIEVQGGNGRVCDDYSLLPHTQNTFPLKAASSGYIYSMDALQIGLAATETGAGRKRKEDVIDYGAGFEFHKKVGDAVKEGDVLATIHSDREDKLEETMRRLTGAIRISSDPPTAREMIHYICDKHGVRKPDVISQ